MQVFLQFGSAPLAGHWRLSSSAATGFGQSCYAIAQLRNSPLPTIQRAVPPDRALNERLASLLPAIFKFTAQRSGDDCLSVGRTGRIIVDLGAAAGVKVSTDPTTGAVKYASAHDLRRSFGARWASRGMPQVLKELMRREAIETTLKYYAVRNAESTADVLWQAHEAAKSSAALGFGGASGGAGSFEPLSADGQSA